jgi:hypothetical protein
MKNTGEFLVSAEETVGCTVVFDQIYDAIDTN